MAKANRAAGFCIRPFVKGRPGRQDGTKVAFARRMRLREVLAVLAWRQQCQLRLSVNLRHSLACDKDGLRRLGTQQALGPFAALAVRARVVGDL